MIRIVGSAVMISMRDATLDVRCAERESRDLGGRGARRVPAAPPAQVPRLPLGMTPARATTHHRHFRRAFLHVRHDHHEQRRREREPQQHRQPRTLVALRDLRLHPRADGGEVGVAQRLRRVEVVEVHECLSIHARSFARARLIWTRTVVTVLPRAVGDFLRAHAFDLAEDHRETLLRRQRVDGAPQQRELVAMNELLVRARRLSFRNRRAARTRACGGGANRGRRSR